jgi:hypothetical protein
VPLQQAGEPHDVLSQTHDEVPPPAGGPTMKPPWQCWPARHSAAPPHMHMPPEQLSARFDGQLMHFCPPVPHRLRTFPLTQRAGDTFMLQQPWQFGGSHTQLPPMHVFPGGHGAPSFLQMQLPIASQLSVSV